MLRRQLRNLRASDSHLHCAAAATGIAVVAAVELRSARRRSCSACRAREPQRRAERSERRRDERTSDLNSFLAVALPEGRGGLHPIRIVEVDLSSLARGTSAGQQVERTRHRGGRARCCEARQTEHPLDRRKQRVVVEAVRRSGSRANGTGDDDRCTPGLADPVPSSYVTTRAVLPFVYAVERRSRGSHSRSQRSPVPTPQSCSSWQRFGTTRLKRASAPSASATCSRSSGSASCAYACASDGK